MSSKAKPPPPKMAPKPGMVKMYRAVFPYEAMGSDELTFDEGDIIFINDTSNGDWWRGTRKGKSGMVPSNYIVLDDTGAKDFPLHEAAKRGNREFLEECIGSKIGMNSRDKSGSTALYWAAHSGHGEIAEILLQQTYTDVNAQNKLGDTPLHAAAWKGHDEIVHLLMEFGANPAIKNAENKTPFELASNAVCASRLKPKGRGSLGSSNDEYLGDGADSD